MKTYKFLEPYTFKNGLKVKNRIVMAPMTTVSSFHDGHLTTDEINYYRLRAGGAGMIISAATYVSKLGRGFDGACSVESDEFLPDLELMANAIKIKGSKAILQLIHTGRMSNSQILKGEQPVSASAVAAERKDSEIPRELSEAEIEKIIDDFAQATHRAIKAGFDGVELHGANTYLLQQFVSSHSNRRRDKWGGSFENRIRFPLAVIDKVKAIINEYTKTPFILGYRLSPEEFETPGIRIKDTLAFIEYLKKTKIDYLHISLGHVWRTSINDKTDTTPIIKQIQQTVGESFPIIGVGSIERPEDAEKVIHEGIEFAAMGREFLREPKWVQKVETDDESSIRYTISPSDFEELLIPTAMQAYLKIFFKKEMHFSNTKKVSLENFIHTVAPMESHTED